MDGPDKIRRGLEAATVGLAAMAEMMDRISAMLEKWDERGLGVSADRLDEADRRAWARAAGELRTVVTPAQQAIAQAVTMLPPGAESTWSMADVRRGYDD